MNLIMAKILKLRKIRNNLIIKISLTNFLMKKINKLKTKIK